MKSPDLEKLGLDTLEIFLDDFKPLDEYSKSFLINAFKIILERKYDDVFFKSAEIKTYS